MDHPDHAAGAPVDQRQLAPAAFYRPAGMCQPKRRAECETFLPVRLQRVKSVRKHGHLWS